MYYNETKKTHGRAPHRTRGEDSQVHCSYIAQADDEANAEDAPFLKPLLVLAILLLLPFPTQAKNCNHDSSTFRCVRYLRNHDGDTIRVRIPHLHPLFGEDIAVRLKGVDTPELYGDGACERTLARSAQRFVRLFLENAEKIELRDVKRDKYFRILAEVWADDVSLALLLLKERLAVPYRGRSKPSVNWCELESPQLVKVMKGFPIPDFVSFTR